MSSEINLPIVNPEDSLAPYIPPESAATEEHKLLKVSMMEMWDAWVNEKEPPIVILGFLEMVPRTDGTTNIPMPNSFIPYRSGPTPNSVTIMPSVARPHAPIPRVAPVVLFAAPTFTL